MTGLILSMCLWASSAGAAGGERWTALSTTAIAITGDVRVSPVGLTFANGSHLQWRFVRRLRRASWAGLPTGGAPVALYRVATAVDPILSNHNRLCGARPAYATVVRAQARGRLAAGADVELAIYSGFPLGDGDDRLCGTFAYAVGGGA